jgi:threonine/homoserine/homoserine lactone efflux protein
MPDLPNLLLFMGATLALNLTPGPDMLYVIARSAGEGRAAGVVSALGIAAGTLVHMFAVAFGLSGVLLAVPVAYDAVRYAGAAYLVYLGVRALLCPGTGPGRAPEPAPLAAVFRQGVVTNVLNPKVALFFLAFLPQFVDPSRGSVALHLLALGVMFNVSGTLVNLAVAVAASGAAQAAGRWGRRGRAAPSERWQRLTGVVFIGLGVRLALMNRK